MATNIIQKIKNDGLAGCGGAGFPVWKKWEAAKRAKNDVKYIVCNGSEGEPLVQKDKFILEKYPAEVINGIKIALETITHSQAYIYLNKLYFQQFKEKLTNLIGNAPIKLFEKPDGYLAGEETTLLNVIEGKKAEPRTKPPYPTESGLWGKPTLINNVETFYWISKIAKGEYQNKRFYCISGQAPNKGVYELPENYTIEQILKETKNYPFPSTNYFYQVGGGASGEILLANELEKPIHGIGSIIIFNKASTNPLSLMKGWAEFFIKNNCDQCAPCREGIYRINEMLIKNILDRSTLNNILAVLEKTSLCPFGRMAAVPFKTAMERLF